MTATLSKSASISFDASTPRWVENAQAIEARGQPVIITIRLAEEGGQWRQADETRIPLFETALRQLAVVDIELRSPILKQVSALASRHQRALIVSHHDFQKTPPAKELKKIMARAANFGTVVKIATLAKTEEDVASCGRCWMGRDPHRFVCWAWGRSGRGPVLNFRNWAPV